MNDYIPKPVDPQVLADVVDKWLARGVDHARSEAAAGTDGKAPNLEPEGPVAVFDRQALVHRMMGDMNLARKVVASFLEDLSEQISALKERLAREDLESVWKQAHTVKGAAANIGGEALKELANEMEMAGKAGDLAAVAARMPELKL